MKMLALVLDKRRAFSRLEVAGLGRVCDAECALLVLHATELCSGDGCCCESWRFSCFSTLATRSSGHVKPLKPFYLSRAHNLSPRQTLLNRRLHCGDILQHVKLNALTLPV